MTTKFIALNLFVLSLCAIRSALAVSLPADFSATQGVNGIFYEGIGDSRSINTTHPAPAGTTLMTFQGDFAGPPGLLPTYMYGVNFPIVQIDAGADVLVMHPGTGGDNLGTGTSNIGASIQFQALIAGLYNATGSFARDNVNFGAGNGVDVLVIKGMNLGSPLFSDHISPNNVTDTTNPFAGTSVVSFNLNVSLLAGEAIRFVVFSDNQGQDGRFDSTAFRANIGQVPEPSTVTLLAVGGLGIAIIVGRHRRAAHNDIRVSVGGLVSAVAR